MLDELPVGGTRTLSRRSTRLDDVYPPAQSRDGRVVRPEASPDGGSSRTNRAIYANPSSQERLFHKALADAARDVRMLAAVTPTNLESERRRLLRELESSNTPVPRFVYAPAPRTELRRALEAMLREVSSFVRDDLLEVYRARIEELDLEAQLAEAAGTRPLGEHARARFVEKDVTLRTQASALAAEWLKIPPPPSRVARRVMSDADDPDSLLSEMRRQIGALRLPFRVEVSESLSSRAAAGERTIWVCKGRPLTTAETGRTVVHEIFGHALPRARSTHQVPIFSIGTARGADDQEGLALLAEERAGLLDDARRRELAARHWAAERMGAGASFGDLVLPLVFDYGLSKDAALGIAERAFRGSDGQGAGIGRERVYIGAWFKLRAHLARRPFDEEVLASGQVALSAVGSLSAAFRTPRCLA